MTFESGLRAYFQIDGEWVEAIGDGAPYYRDGVGITLGYADEGRQQRPASCSFTVKNHDLRYSPDNPMSPYDGNFGQGTPVAITTRPLMLGLQVPRPTATGAFTLDSLALSITGDIDLRAEVAGFVGGPEYPVYKGTSYYLTLTAGGGGVLLGIQWYDAGAVLRTATSTVTVPSGDQALRATLDVDNGAGGYTAVFYTAPAWGDPWVQLGAAVTSTAIGPTAIQNTAGSAVCGYTAGSGEGITVTHVEILSGIAGTVVASPDFSAQAVGAPSLVDGQGNTWVVWDESRIDYLNDSCRFVGEVTDLQDGQDTSGNDHFVEVSAAGVVARLGQGASEIKTALRSWVPTRVAGSFEAEAYWPLEEGPAASNGAPDVGGDVLWFQNPPNPIARFGNGDLRLPWFKPCVRLLAGDRLVSSVNMSTGKTAWEIDFLYACGDDADMTVHLYTEVTISDRLTIREWQLQLKPSTSELVIISPDGTDTSVTTDFLGFDFDPFDGVGKLVQARFYQDAGVPTTARVNFVISTNYPGESTHGSNGIINDGFATTRVLTNVGRLERVDFEHVGQPDRPFSLAHVAAFSCIDTTSIYTIEVPAAGHVGEEAAERMQRLCDENDVPIDFAAADTSNLMGPQRPMSLLNALSECVEADQGLLVESRASLDLGLHYIPLVQLYNATAAVTLDKSANELAPSFALRRDSRDTRNDVTARRQDGAEARFEQTVGRLAVSEVGRYDTSVTVNVASDSQLGDHAAWLVHLGTVDEPRMRVTVNLARPAIAGLVSTIRLLGVGDRLDVVGLESSGIYDTVKLLILGYSERLNRYEHTITFTCAPAAPYQTLVLDAAGPLAKLDSLGSELNEDLDTTETSVEVAITDGTLWTTSGGQMPIPVKVGGEVMSVTAISGASSPQTFTVTRSVNSVVKAHAAGTPVLLERPATLAYVKGM